MTLVCVSVCLNSKRIYSFSLTGVGAVITGNIRYLNVVVCFSYKFAVPEGLPVTHCRAHRTCHTSFTHWLKPGHLPRLNVLFLPVTRPVSPRKHLLLEVNMKCVSNPIYGLCAGKTWLPVEGTSKIVSWHIFVKGDIHPKMKVSYLVEFGTLSQMVKVRGACDKPFRVYKRLYKLRGPAR